MKKIILVIVAVTTMIITVFAQNNGDALKGEWFSAKKDSKFLIYKQENAYFGKIVWGTGSQTKDEKNPDTKLRNRDVIGLIMLKDFVFDGKYTWKNGTIYDPREGKTYSCIITMKDNDRINVRGYVGISLFGRSEVWTRATQ
jgi:uncharacterized protein (DUF2147 family)